MNDQIRECIGKPLFTFGKFGVAYPARIEQQLLNRCTFDPIETIGPLDDPIHSIGKERKRRRVLIRGFLNDEIKAIANQHYVCLLMDPHGEEKDQPETTGVAGSTRQEAFQSAF